VVIASFHGVFAPRGTPPEALKVLEAAIEKTMLEKDVKDKMESFGLGWVYLGRKDGATYLAQQDAIFRALIEELGMMVAPKK
jgi:tripartite-type tricarboxylate transporter receptor subunit TctC